MANKPWTSVGADLNNAGGKNDDFAVKTRVGANNGQWLRVIANTALATGNAVSVAASGTAILLTPALALVAGEIGICPTAVSSGSSCWVQLTGDFDNVAVAANTQSGVPLYTSDTAGVLDDVTNSASHFAVTGLLLIATNSGSASHAPAVAQGFLTIRRPAA